LTIIKRGSRNIIGENFSWLFERVERDRINLARKAWGKAKHIEKIGQLKALESSYPEFKEHLDKIRPYVDELPDNKAYCTWINQEFKLLTVSLPNFHFHQSTEDWLADSDGITWHVNKDKKPIEKSELSKKERNELSRNTKKIKDDILTRISQMKEVEKKSWEKIREELIQLEIDGIIPNMDFEEKTPIYLSNWYGKWKKKQS